MGISISAPLIGSGVVLAAALAIVPAQADSLQLSWSLTNDGSGNVIAGSGTSTGLAVPGTYSYTNTHGVLDAIVNGSISALYPSGFEFYDDFVFTVSEATTNAVTSTIDLGASFGIADLQVRLYSADGQTGLPVPGVPAGGVIDAWSSPVSAGGVTGTIAVLPATVLGAGTYVLEIRGNITGAVGGSYSGTLNVEPVPVPAAALLFGSALSGLVAARRRRRFQ